MPATTAHYDRLPQSRTPMSERAGRKRIKPRLRAKISFSIFFALPKVNVSIRSRSLRRRAPQPTKDCTEAPPGKAGLHKRISAALPLRQAPFSSLKRRAQNIENILTRKRSGNKQSGAAVIHAAPALPSRTKPAPVRNSCCRAGLIRSSVRILRRRGTRARKHAFSHGAAAARFDHHCGRVSVPKAGPCPQASTQRPAPPATRPCGWRECDRRRFQSP